MNYSFEITYIYNVQSNIELLRFALQAVLKGWIS